MAESDKHFFQGVLKALHEAARKKEGWLTYAEAIAVLGSVEVSNRSGRAYRVIGRMVEEHWILQEPDDRQNDNPYLYWLSKRGARFLGLQESDVRKPSLPGIRADDDLQRGTCVLRRIRALEGEARSREARAAAMEREAKRLRREERDLRERLTFLFPRLDQALRDELREEMESRGYSPQVISLAVSGLCTKEPEKAAAAIEALDAPPADN